MAELLRSLQDSQLVARFQRRCGLFPAPEDNPRENSAGPSEGTTWAYVEKHVVKNYFYYYLFRFSAALGQEVFYITFLPFTHWNIDPYLSRRLVMIWVLVMYIGQVAKDILKWPRPSSPPVVKLEKRVVAEYGMPSTHAMAATAISFTLLISSMDRYQYPFVLGLTMAVVFSTLVCLSRLYTGMHTVLLEVGPLELEMGSLELEMGPLELELEMGPLELELGPLELEMGPLELELEMGPLELEMGPLKLELELHVVVSHVAQDVLGGVLITAFLIALTYPAWTLIDSLDSASPLFPVCVIVVPFFLCYNYPVSDFYSPTRADTTTIVAAGAGVTLGFWINHFFQLVSQPSPSLPVIRNIPPLTTDMLVLGLTKFTVGIVLIILVRQLVQNLSLQVLFSWFKVVTRNKEARRRLEIEVPYKFVTYTSVGICATTFVPMLHRCKQGHTETPTLSRLVFGIFGCLSFQMNRECTESAQEWVSFVLWKPDQEKRGSPAIASASSS
ncbi:Sphingosine-1-phosphate phosphatase 2 [Microtus ochrogaster]|uniref:Sphingosine-1-phosphate phosphatase 2 n=1 Tax=Microtus ochrogaster TaxID=79684 RepID=A0A8J6KXC4_MICOH|nr:Sphingosine-1-phosphate phosphatase 2 [Microtus ochrogaster]